MSASSVAVQVSIIAPSTEVTTVLILAVNAGTLDDMDLIGKKDLVLMDLFLRKERIGGLCKRIRQDPENKFRRKHTGGNENRDSRYLAGGQRSRSGESIPSSSIYLRKESVITNSSPEPQGIICTQNSPTEMRSSWNAILEKCNHQRAKANEEHEGNWERRVSYVLGILAISVGG